MKAEIYAGFADYYLNLAKTSDVPVLILRFEDILKEKELMLNELFKFTLNLESLDGLYI